jgi:hypothetical protein
MTSHFIKSFENRVKKPGLALFMTVALLMFACGNNQITDNPEKGEAIINVGAADGTGDQADSQCKVVLRSVSRVPYQGDYKTTCTEGIGPNQSCRYIWKGYVDVASSFVSQILAVEVLYQTQETGSDWYVTQAQQEGKGTNGMTRYSFMIFFYTIGPKTNINDVHKSFINLIPYVVTSKGRLVDHNRVADPMDAYHLTIDNSWAVTDDTNVCNGSTINENIPEYIFSYPDMKDKLVNGPVKAGGKLKINYDIDRLIKNQSCLGSEGSASGTTIMMGWTVNEDSESAQKTEIGTYLESYSCYGNESPCITENVTQPIIDVPSEARLLTFWFYCVPGFSYGSETYWKYDSNYGNNYNVDVVNE